MQYSYSLHQEAYEEFLDAVEWYKERGQATRYRAKIKQAIQAIRDNPFSWQTEGEDKRFRRYIVDTFPYKIVYAIHEGDRHVYVIAATSRPPAYWQRRAE